MTEFKLIFVGRLKHSDAKLQRYAVKAHAADRQAAVLSLFEVYTSIRLISVEELPNDPIRVGHGHAEDGTELRAPGRA